MIGERMSQDIYSLSEDYNFEGVEEGVSIVWSGKPLEGDEKNYRVTFIQKVRKVTEITASSEEEAIIRAGFRVSGNKQDYDAFILGADVSIERIK
jgi:hypothetical protein